MTLARTLLLSLLLGCLLAAPASGASRFTIRGAGYGHGVGMSQYGAYGFALHGSGYRDILRHYYTGTQIGSVDPAREVRVLLQSPRGSAAFAGGSRAGTRRIDPARTYRVRRHGGAEVDLLSARGRRLARFAAPLRVTGPAPLVLKGRAGNGRVGGAYRGALEFRPGAFAGVNAINAVRLDDYVQGVVPDESPPSWPIEALKAQAVAARSYAVTSSRAGAGFEHYPDTRSQVYGGVAAEEPSTNAAVAQTRGEVVTYQGQPVITYFFSTSGGRTEDVENTPLGNEPRAWLKSVADPYDSVSPRHRWGPIRMSLTRAGRKLRGLVRGRFRGVKVVARGTSPRIVAADVVGSRGRTRVSGATLRARLGLYDTWAYFTAITSAPAPAPADSPPSQPPPQGTGAPTGGSSYPNGSAARLQPVAGLRGRILPARRGAMATVERRVGGSWITVGATVVGRAGRYHAPAYGPGTYRVRVGDALGPPVRVR
jgi:stage II sporulation protein D